MPVATSTAILIGAAAIGSGAQAYQANQARQQQKKGLNFQKQAQAQAEGMAMRESELAAMERKKQQAQTPDVASMLTGDAFIAEIRKQIGEWTAVAKQFNIVVS